MTKNSTTLKRQIHNPKLKSLVTKLLFGKLIDLLWQLLHELLLLPTTHPETSDTEKQHSIIPSDPPPLAGGDTVSPPTGGGNG